MKYRQDNRIVPRPRPPDAGSLRAAMRRFATGVTVITTGGERCHGMTANAFTSVSLDPPLVACCIAGNAYMHQAVGEAGEFAVSILSADQENLARYFCDRGRPHGAAQFSRVPTRPGARTGAPLLSGAVAWLECRVAVAYDGGDHTIFLGEVVNSEWTDDAEALVFCDGCYHASEPHAEHRRGEAV